MAETKVTNDPKATPPTATPTPTPQQAQAAQTAQTDQAQVPVKVKRVKTPIPEGWVAPVQFAHDVDKHLNQPDGTTPPQVIYGFIKNSKEFPFQERTQDDFPRFIVNKEQGLKFIDELQVKRQERASKKATKDAALAAALQAQQAAAQAPKSS
jgi:hypothetical protein